MSIEGLGNGVILGLFFGRFLGIMALFLCINICWWLYSYAFWLPWLVYGSQQPLCAFFLYVTASL